MERGMFFHALVSVAPGHSVIASDSPCSIAVLNFRAASILRYENTPWNGYLCRGDTKKMGETVVLSKGTRVTRARG